MPTGGVIEFDDVSKRYGNVVALDAFSARIESGAVTGFVGPNGAGKTTALRVLLGLTRADAGSARIDGQQYRELRHPLQTVGAVLETHTMRPNHTAAKHLNVLARKARIAPSRVDEVLGEVGLADAAGHRVREFSLGMRQRLAIAGALLGDPGVLVLDEPTNGLDTEGIVWMRGLLRNLAREGRTVLISSHQLGELVQSADLLAVISQGRLVFEGPIAALTDTEGRPVVADAADRRTLATALRQAGVDAEVLRAGVVVHGADAASVGEQALAAGIPLKALGVKGPGLEQIFLDLVAGEPRATTPVRRTAPSPDTSFAAPEAADAAPAAQPTAPPVGHALTRRITTQNSATERPATERPAFTEPEPSTGEWRAFVAADALARVQSEDPDIDVATPPLRFTMPEPDDAAWVPIRAAEASFSVASTGVIDIIAAPADEAGSAS